MLFWHVAFVCSDVGCPVLQSCLKKSIVGKCCLFHCCVCLSPFLSDLRAPSHPKIRNIERNTFQKAIDEDSETEAMPKVSDKFGDLGRGQCGPEMPDEEENDDGHWFLVCVYFPAACFT